MRYLVLGERVNSKVTPEVDIRKWSKMWKDFGWRAALLSPSMPMGKTKAKLLSLIPEVVHHDVTIVNVLPPDTKLGAWDNDLASSVACQASDWIKEEKQVRGIITLGRRVTNIFSVGVPLCGLFEIGGKPALHAPHPSGLNRKWNCPETAWKVKVSVNEFINNLEEMDSYDH